MTDGLLLVDKPPGMTSADVVRIIKRRWQCKTGHLGTLDPFATGLLPICLGEGTKLAPFLNDADKMYAGRIQLGARTATGDPTGPVVETAPVPALAAAQIEAAARRFSGELLQTPPMYSALKQNGTPLYTLARRGIAVPRAQRRIHIHALDLTLATPSTLDFNLWCSKGTYVRVLAEDLATALGTLGHLLALRRTRFGSFRIEDAVDLQTCTHGQPPVVGLREALALLPEFRLDARAAGDVRLGREAPLDQLPPGAINELAKVIDASGALAAVILMDPAGRWRFARVFPPPGDGASGST